MSDLNLFDDFPSTTQQDWQALVEKGLKGAGFDNLIKTNQDALTRGPLSTASERPDSIAAHY
jgi:hypothetical protein